MKRSAAQSQVTAMNQLELPMWPFKTDIEIAMDQLELPMWSLFFKTDIDNAIASLAKPDTSCFETNTTRVSGASGKTCVPSLPTQAFYSTSLSAEGAHDTHGFDTDEPRETLLPGPDDEKDKSLKMVAPIFCVVQKTTEGTLDLDSISWHAPADAAAESLFEQRKGHCDPSLKSPSKTYKGQKKATVRSQWSAEDENKFIKALAKWGPEGCTEAKIDERTGRVTVILGPGVAEMISHVLGTRSVSQVRSHAQKHFIRLHRQSTKPFTQGSHMARSPGRAPQF